MFPVREEEGPAMCLGASLSGYFGYEHRRSTGRAHTVNGSIEFRSKENRSIPIPGATKRVLCIAQGLHRVAGKVYGL